MTVVRIFCVKFRPVVAQPLLLMQIGVLLVNGTKLIKPVGRLMTLVATSNNIRSAVNVRVEPPVSTLLMLPALKSMVGAVKLRLLTPAVVTLA